MDERQAVYFEVISKLEYKLHKILQSIPYDYATNISEIRLIAGEYPVVVLKNKQKTTRGAAKRGIPYRSNMRNSTPIIYIKD